MSNEEFIDRVKFIHGDKFDLSKINFNGYKNKVKVICKKHGEFEIFPGNLLSGRGCQKCSNEKKSEKMSSGYELFIEQAKKVHHDKYDYSKVKYKNCDSPVCIICPEHGEFWQTPYVHLKGHGCRKCANKTIKDKLSFTKEEFIKKAKDVHHDKYDYSNVEYKNIDEKVCIICPEHGEFWQTPYVHLKGHGCKKCSNEKLRHLKLKSNEEFIEKAKEVHRGKYDYSKVEYEGCFKKVCIICPEHGEFWQTPDNHLQGRGCPRCMESHLEREIRFFLEEKSINYEYRKKNFEWLNGLELDFYLPDFNIAIECQGEQHFFPVDFAGKGKEWALTEHLGVVERDTIKYKLCCENNVKLYYFSDKNFDENIVTDINKLERIIKMEQKYLSKNCNN